MSDDAEKKDAKDMVLLHSRTDDGEGFRVLRAREGQVETGELRALKEGAPIASGDVVRLHRRDESPLLWNVEVQCSVPKSAAAHAGPARVTTGAYRRNWGAIFGEVDDDADDASRPELSTMN